MELTLDTAGPSTGSLDAVLSRVAELRQMMSSQATSAPAAGKAASGGQATAFQLALDSAAAATSAPSSAGVAAPAAPGAGGTARSGVDVDQFARDVLARVGAPVTGENMRLMRAWVSSEGTAARFNPLATTKTAAGATAFNSVGVKNYTSYDQGVTATVQTLLNGRYPAVLSGLREGGDALKVADAIAASPWGTGGLVRRRLEQGVGR